MLSWKTVKFILLFILTIWFLAGGRRGESSLCTISLKLVCCAQFLNKGALCSAFLK